MSSSPRRVELREWGRAFVGPLTEPDLAALGRLGGRLEVESVAGGHLVWATSYVGVVRLPTLEVHVSPKLAGGELGLVRLLAWAAGLDSLEGRRDATPLLALGGNSLVDLLGLLLVQASEAVVRRGLLGDYVEEDEVLPAVRGRILMRRQLLERHGRVDRVWCRHDELRQDVDENRLLSFGLAVALRRCRDPGVLRRAQALREVLAAVCDPGPVPAARDLPAIGYHRLNGHYRWGHELARLVIEGDQIKDLLQGDRRCFAFLLDMNRLFERFIERLLKELGCARGVAVTAQARDTSIIRDSRGEPYASVRPDLLLSWPAAGGPGRRLAVDAKYKPYERGVGSGDLYQAFLYAFAYATAADASAVLLYPASDGLLAREELQVRTSGGRGDARITAVAVPIARVLEELRTSGLTGPLVAELWGVVDRGTVGGEVRQLPGPAAAQPTANVV